MATQTRATNADETLRKVTKTVLKKPRKVVKKSATKTKIPKGFTAVSAGGQFGEWHDFNKQKILTGKVVEIGKYNGEYGEQKTLTINAGKTLHTISESAGLKGLFAEKNLKGREVYIVFEGLVKIPPKRKGGKPKSFKKFVTAIK
jgi:hypothetical protein